MVAVGATGLLILLFGGPAEGEADAAAAGEPTRVEATTPPGPTGSGGAGSAPAAVDQQTEAGTAAGMTAADTGAALDTVPDDPAAGAREATGTLRELAVTVYNTLPALGIAVALLLIAALLARLLKLTLRSLLSSWERAEAIAALAAIGLWLVALGAALSVVAGDARALVGSIGLFGLALSWALQTPIESFTGWLLNSFRSYYRPGDRIAVGPVFGDVARIDFLTTTVFEAGGPEKNVRAAQSTGALVTFPNSEILRSNVINYTRDFPYVYDELTVAIANESDIAWALEVIQGVADQVVGQRMEGAAEAYSQLLERAHLAWNVATGPELYVNAQDSWTEVVIRYLVPVREMRKWSTTLQLALNDALSAPEVADRVFTGYTRTQVQPLPSPAVARVINRSDSGTSDNGGDEDSHR